MDPIEQILQGSGSSHADDKYRRLEAEFGASLMRDATIHTIVAVLIRTGVISKSEFIDGIEYNLRFGDAQRRKAAGLD